MIEILLYFSTYILALLIGVFIGSLLDKGKVNDYKKPLKKEVVEESADAGVIKRPTAEELRKRNTIEGETEAVMEETLDKLL